MTLLDSAMRTVHLLTGAVLTGSVVFFAFGVLRATDRDGVGDAAVRSLAGGLTTISRASAVVLLVTGGHMARPYLGGGVTAAGSVHLVLTMVVLWVVVTGLVEAGAARLRGGAAPADAASFYTAAALASLLVLVDAGVLASGGL